MESRRKARLNQKKEDLQKKVGRAVTTEVIGGFTSLACGVGMVMCALGGSTGVIAADGEMERIAKSIVETDEYQTYIQEKKNELLDKFSNGEISYAEFKAEYEKLYTKDGVIEFAKVSEHPLLTEKVEEYHKQRNEGRELANGALYMLAGATIGCATTGTAEFIKRKYNSKLSDVVNELEDNKEMAD